MKRRDNLLQCSTWMTTVFIVLCLGNVDARAASPSDRPANGAAQSVHDEATRILDSIQKTKYQHRTDINEDKGLYLCDCSGFVGYVLNRTVGREEEKGPFGDGRKRPLAMHYEKFFATAPTQPNGDGRWQRVVRLEDARPGDVIAWRHEKPRPGNTGHVVIVDQRPVREDDGLVRVVVIDSTTKPQVDDTRAPGTSGVGRGAMWFKIDDRGRPVGSIRGSRTAEPKIESISIGRPLPTAKKKSASRRAA